MFELISKKQAAISNAIDAKVSYTEVAELLKSASNVQLEVAKRLVANESLPTEIGSVAPVSTVSPADGETKEDLYERLYRLSLETQMKRRRKKVVSPRQLSLFG